MSFQMTEPCRDKMGRGWFYPPEAGVLKKLSLVGLAKLIRIRYSWLGFGLDSAGYCGLVVYERLMDTAG